MQTTIEHSEKRTARPGSGKSWRDAVGFWERYRSSLKGLAVEEPIDVFWHRFLGYFLARASYPTFVTPDMITVAAIFIGVASGVCIAVDFPHHMIWGAALCTLSAVFDCADGQLARMRKSSSTWGRALDGTCDIIVGIAIGVGAAIHVLHVMPWYFWVGVAMVPVFAEFHFGHYDHYKNVYLRLTEPGSKEGDDLETAIARRDAALAQPGVGLTKRFVWWLFMQYVTSQTNYIRATDPYTTLHYTQLPPYDAHRAEIYHRHAIGPMRMWRTFFGVGTHVFTMSLAIAFDKFEWYVFFRVVVLNALDYLIVLPWQRRASKAAFEEMGLRFPDQRGFEDEETATA
jgi:hypothetical protein